MRSYLNWYNYLRIFFVFFSVYMTWWAWFWSGDLAFVIVFVIVDVLLLFFSFSSLDSDWVNVKGDL